MIKSNLRGNRTCLIAVTAAIQGFFSFSSAQKLWDLPLRWSQPVVPTLNSSSITRYGDTLYALTSFGFAKSGKPFTNWSHTNLVVGEASNQDSWQTLGMSFLNKDTGCILVSQVRHGTKNVLKDLLIRTENAGLSWTPKYLNAILNNIAYLDKSHLIGIDDSGVVTSDDNGQSWTRRYTSYRVLSLKKIKIINQERIFVLCAGGGILRSTNGGVSWERVANDMPWEIFDLQMADSLVGFAANLVGNVYKTDDGGLTWKVVGNTGVSRRLSSLTFSDKNEGYAAGEQGYIVKTTDGGAHWQTTKAITQPTSNHPGGVSDYTDYGWIGYSDGNNLVALAADLQSISYTSNAGSTWSAFLLNQPVGAFGDVWQFETGKHLLGVNKTLSSISTDFRTATTVKSFDFQIKSVQFRNAQNGYLVLVGVSNGSADVYSTEDGGSTWNPFFYLDNEEIYNFIPLSGDKFVAVTWTGIVIVSSDGGKNWTSSANTVTADSGKNWTKVAGNSSNLHGRTNSMSANKSRDRLMTGGNGGHIYLSKNNGESWDSVSSGTSAEIFRVKFISNDVAYAVGANGTILNSSDSGLTWTAQISGMTVTLRDIDFVDNNVGYCVGDQVILYTENGGKKWSPVSQLDRTTWYKIILNKEGIAFVYGQTGALGSDITMARKAASVDSIPEKIEFIRKMNLQPRIRFEGNRVIWKSFPYNVNGKKLLPISNKSAQIQ